MQPLSAKPSKADSCRTSYIFCLPPNTTHFTQLLNKHFFDPFMFGEKNATTKSWKGGNTIRICMTPANVISGLQWHIPLQLEAITTGCLDHVSSLAQETGYIFPLVVLQNIKLLMAGASKSLFIQVGEIVVN